MSETTPYPIPFGSYVLLEHLGRGGMADVELARRVVDDAGFVRFLVIKRIQAKHADNTSFVRMFTDEARISAELQQENIAQVYDFGQVDEQYFLAMEYVPGVHLRHVQRILANRGQVPPFRVTFRVIADVLTALQYAHHRVDTFGRPMRLVHRDVNPRNIMLSVRGEVKLIDFGVAKADTRAEHTVGKSMKGKFAYMAPEQIEGNTPVDGRTDLFAMGLVLHELVAGRSPFAGMSEAQIVHQTIMGPVPLLKVPALYPDSGLLRAIHDRALAKNIEDRYADASAMREDIVKAANAVGGLASREEMAEFLRRVAPDDVMQITNRLKAYRELGPVPAPMPTLPPVSGEERVTPAEPTLVPSVVGPPVGTAGSATAATTPASTPRDPRRLAATVGLSVLAALAFALALLLPPRPLPAPSEPAPAAAPPEPATTTVAQPPVEKVEPPDPNPPVTPPEPGPDGQREPRRPDRNLAQPKSTPGSEPAPTVTTSAAAPEAPQEQGFLNVSSAPDKGFDVYFDGQKMGETPLKSLRVPTGHHEIVIEDTRTGRSWTRKVDVLKGRTSVVSTEEAP